MSEPLYPLGAVRLDDAAFEIPVTARAGMRVPARVYADDALFAKISQDRSLEQLLNVAMLPGVTDRVLAMPDAHEGYGFPVGGVAAFDLETGVISPGGVGYDIDCGVRLLRADLPLARLKPVRFLKMQMGWTWFSHQLPQHLAPGTERLGIAGFGGGRIWVAGLRGLKLATSLLTSIAPRPRARRCGPSTGPARASCLRVRRGH